MFFVTLAIGFCLMAWLTLSISTFRYASLMLTIFIIEYIKEGIGTISNLWTYHGRNIWTSPDSNEALINFGVLMWVMGGIAVYTVATKLIIPWLRKLDFSPPRYVHPLIIILLFALIPLLLGKYAAGAGFLFYALYLFLFAVCLFASLKMEFPVFAGILVAALIGGFPAEYAGSMGSGIWTFTHNPDYPPLFLLVSCWPLEIMAQYSISSYIAAEDLNKGTF